jgi:hypothetical protein
MYTKLHSERAICNPVSASWWINIYIIQNFLFILSATANVCWWHELPYAAEYYLKHTLLGCLQSEYRLSYSLNAVPAFQSQNCTQNAHLITSHQKIVVLNFTVITTLSSEVMWAIRNCSTSSVLSCIRTHKQTEEMKTRSLKCCNSERWQTRQLFVYIFRSNYLFNNLLKYDHMTLNHYA